MINLLPPDVKESYHYARRNTRLVSWVVALSFAFAGMALLSIGGILYLKQEADTYQPEIAAAQAKLDQQNQKAVEKEVKEISSNLKLTVQVLSKQVLYSQLLKQLAVAIPSDATLSNLTITQGVNAVDIAANTVDYNAATQLQVNLADPKNKIFSKADIVTISCLAATGTGSGTPSRYPCSVTIRALIEPNNPFLFVNSTKKTTP